MLYRCCRWCFDGVSMVFCASVAVDVRIGATNAVFVPIHISMVGIASVNMVSQEMPVRNAIVPWDLTRSKRVH